MEGVAVHLLFLLVLLSSLFPFWVVLLSPRLLLWSAAALSPLVVVPSLSLVGGIVPSFLPFMQLPSTRWYNVCKPSHSAIKKTHK